MYGNIALNGGAISWGFATTITTGASSYGLTVSTTGSNGKSVLVKDTSDYAGITITAGNGSTNPSKTLRCNASTGNFELIDNGYLNIIASITNAGNISFLGGTLSSSASNLNIQATNSSGAVLLTAWNGAANSQVGIAGAVFRSSTDNGTTLGAPSLRWSIVYAATGAINTSDATEKTPLRMLTSAELDCAKDILDGIGIYQWLDAIARKGADKARLHMGVIAQQVQASFIKYGLDPTRYGLFCFDQWDAVAPTLTTDDDGNEVVQMPGVAAGQRYGVRYDELHTFLCACIHQRLLKIEQQLNITS